MSESDWTIVYQWSEIARKVGRCPRLCREHADAGWCARHGGVPRLPVVHPPGRSPSLTREALERWHRDMTAWGERAHARAS